MEAVDGQRKARVKTQDRRGKDAERNNERKEDERREEKHRTEEEKTNRGRTRERKKERADKRRWNIGRSFRSSYSNTSKFGGAVAAVSWVSMLRMWLWLVFWACQMWKYGCGSSLAHVGNVTCL